MPEVVRGVPLLPLLLIVVFVTFCLVYDVPNTIYA